MAAAIGGASAGPRLGTRNYTALKTLALSGPLTLEAWMRGSDWREGREKFDLAAWGALARMGMVKSDGTLYQVTPAAIAFLGPAALIVVDDVPAVPPVVVGPPYTNGIKALDVKRHFPQRLVREGAAAYRNIPSLMAGERVAYKA